MICIGKRAEDSRTAIRSFFWRCRCDLAADPLDAEERAAPGRDAGHRGGIGDAAEEDVLVAAVDEHAARAAARCEAGHEAADGGAAALAYSARYRQCHWKVPALGGSVICANERDASASESSLPNHRLSAGGYTRNVAAVGAGPL